MSARLPLSTWPDESACARRFCWCSHLGLLVLAGVCEIGWAIGLKYTDGFSRLLPSVITLLLMAVSIVLLAVALKQIPLGTGYAVWTGIGAAGTAILGMFLFDESREALRLLFLGLIVAGIVGLKLVSTE